LRMHETLLDDHSSAPEGEKRSPHNFPVIGKVSSYFEWSAGLITTGSQQGDGVFLTQEVFKKEGDSWEMDAKVMGVPLSGSFQRDFLRGTQNPGGFCGGTGQQKDIAKALKKKNSRKCLPCNRVSFNGSTEGSGEKGVARLRREERVDLGTTMIQGVGSVLAKNPCRQRSQGRSLSTNPCDY